MTDAAIDPFANGADPFSGPIANGGGSAASANSYASGTLPSDAPFLTVTRRGVDPFANGSDPFEGPSKTPAPAASSGQQVGGFESGIRGVEQGFLFNQQRRISGLAAASGLQPPIYSDPNVANRPATPDINPLEAAVGGVRMLGENIAPSVFGSGAHQAYDRVQQQEDARNAAAQQQHPIAYGVGQVAGSVVNPVVAAAIPAPVAGAPLLASMARAAIPSGALGAVYGAGEGNTPQEMAQGAGAGALGGVVGGAALGAIGRTLAGSGAAANAVAAPAGRDVVDAAQRLSGATGAPVEIPRAVTSDNMLVQRGAATLRNVPFVGDPLVKGAERAIGQIGGAADALASQVGGASAEQAGNTARQGIENYVGPVSSARVKTLYDRVDTMVNPTVRTDLVNTRNVDSAIAAARDAAGLSPSRASELVAKAIGMQGPNGQQGLTYAGIKTLRTTVGEMLDNHSLLPADTSKTELKRIYAGLSQDLQQSVARSGGPDALKAFQRANTYNRLVADRRADLVRLLGGNTNSRSDEGVFGAVVRAAGSTNAADAKLLQQARRSMPASDWTEIASGVIGRLGRDPEGHFSPDRFVTDYGKLSDAGKDLLFNSTGNRNLRQSLDDIATISSRFKDLKKFANPSGTAQGIEGFGLLAAAWANPFHVIPGAIAGRLLASALAKPETAAATANWARAVYNYSVRPTSTGAKAALQASAKSLASVYGAKLGAVIDPEKLALRAMNPLPTNADEDQVGPNPSGEQK